MWFKTCYMYVCIRRYTWSTRHVLSIVDIEGKFAFILKPFRRMLLRFWKASLGPTQAGRRGCWHLYPPQPGLAGLGWLGWLVTMGDNFSAFQRRVQSLKAPLLRVGPFISGAQWPQIRHNILRDHSQRGHASPRGGGGGPRLIVRGCCIHCFVETWSLGHGDTPLPHSLCRVCPFIDVTTWSQQAPWESGMFSTHILVFIFAFFIHRFDNLKPLCHSAADP